MPSTTSRPVEAAAAGAEVAPDVHTDRSTDIEVRREGSRWFWAIAATGALALFIVHLVQVAQMRSPVIYYDEGGYLGNARYLVSGYGRNGGNYFAGYSLLLAPGAAITHSASAFFHASLITNAVLAVGTAVLALVLSRQIVPHAPQWVALVVAGIVAACPFVFTFVGLAMSENALIPVTLLGTVLVAWAARNDAWWIRLGVVLVAGFAYWVTARGVIVAGAALLALLVLTYERRRAWWTFAVEVGAMGVVLLAGQLFENAVRGTSHVVGVTNRPHGLLEAVFHPADWRSWLAGIFGRFAYLGVASVGFVLIGIVIGLVWLRPRNGRSPSELARVQRCVAAFAVPAVVITAVADATAIAGIPVLPRLDYVYYGRYAEAVAMPAVVIGATWMLTSALSRRHEELRRVLVLALSAGVSIAVMGVLTRALANRRPPDKSSNVVNILGLFSIQHGLMWLNVNAPSITKALLIGSAAVTATLALVAWRVRVFAVLPIILLAASSVAVHDRYLRPGSQFRGSQHAIADAIQVLHANGVPTACVDSAPPTSSFWFFGNYQFFLPQTKFTLPGETPNPKCALVITSAGGWAQSHPTDRLVAMENYDPTRLWLRTSVLTPAERARVERAGLVVPGAACAPLPADAYRSAIGAEVSGAVHSSSDLQHLRVALDVTHSGAGAPWLGSHAITNDAGCGRVEVVVSVEDENGQTVTQRIVPTPEGLFPGQSWHLHPRVVDAKTKPVLAAGHRYRLRVQLVQDGVRKFGGPDGNGVTVPLGAT